MCLSITCVFCVHVQMPCAIFPSMSCRLFCSLWFGLCSPSRLPGTRSRRRCLGSIAPDNLGFGRSWRNYLLTLQCLQPSPGHFVIRHLKQFLGALKHDSSSLTQKYGLTLRRIKPSTVWGVGEGCEGRNTCISGHSNLSILGSVLGTLLGNLLEKGNIWVHYFKSSRK